MDSREWPTTDSRDWTTMANREWHTIIGSQAWQTMECQYLHVTDNQD